MTSSLSSGVLYPNCQHCGRELKAVIWDLSNTFGSLCCHSDGCLCQLPDSLLCELLNDSEAALEDYRVFRATALLAMGLDRSTVAQFMGGTHYPLPCTMLEDIRTILAFRLVENYAKSCESVLEVAA